MQQIKFGLLFLIRSKDAHSRLERGLGIKVFVFAVALILSHNSRRQPHRSLITDGGEKKELTYADHSLTAGCPQGRALLSPLR